MLAQGRRANNMGNKEGKAPMLKSAARPSFNNLGNLGEMFRDIGRTYSGDGRSQESQAVPRLLVFS